MGRVPTRTFCCCIPVRAGAIMLSILGLVGGAGIAAIGITNLKLAEGSKIASVLQVIIYLLLAIVSIFGLIGSITRRLAFVRAYMGMLFVHLIFSIGSGIYAIHRNFQDAPKYISDCTSGSKEPGVIKVCTNGAIILKSFMIGSFIVGWLLVSWAFAIVAQYSKQLADEERARNYLKDTESR